MKKMTAVLTLTAFLAMGCAAYAVETQTKGYISVSAETSEELSPTVVKLTFAVQTNDNNAKITGDNNKKTSENVIRAVKSLIDETKGESIKTTSYYLSPQYSYKDGTRKLTGYSASNTLQVTLKNIDKAGSIISTALQNGANSVTGVEYTLEETGGNCNVLISKAAKNARERADKIAQSLGTTVTGIKNINTGCSSSSNFSSNFRMMQNAKMADGALAVTESSSMPLEAGKTKLNAYVNADFYVK